MTGTYGADPRPEPASDEELQGLRVPPHSVEAEYSVLGGLLVDNRAWDKVGDLLRDTDFYRLEHRLIFAAISRLINAGKPADVVTVLEALDDQQRATVGGLAYLNQVAQSVPSASNVRRYSEIVRSRSVQRQVAALALDLQGAVMGRMEGPEIMTAVDGAVTALLQLMQGADPREPVLLEDLMLELLDEVQALAEGKRPAISTGFADLDEATAGGGRSGELWVIGARPSMGKSAFVLTLALLVTAQDWGLVLSQEDSKLTLSQRVVANLGRVNLADIRNPIKVRDQDKDRFWSGVVEGAELARSRRMLVDDQGALTLADVRRKVQQAQRLAGGQLKVVVVDYLQLMTGEKENRNQLLGEICFGLQALAKEFGVWILLCSQLSREADKRSGLPHVSDLRDSGDIEAAAHVIALLHREARRKATPENKHWAQAELGKNKNGPTCTVNLFFDGKHQLFANWDGRAVPAAAGGGRGGKSEAGGLN